MTSRNFVAELNLELSRVNGMVLSNNEATEIIKNKADEMKSIFNITVRKSAAKESKMQIKKTTGNTSKKNINELTPLM